MAIKFRDYYEVLGVSRTATQDEIRAAYRKLARQLHPDVNKSKNAEEKFKEINEAHEVLGDAEKRKRYDRLGANYHAGDEFSPPPGWQGRSVHGMPAGSSFSDFFETLFGQNFENLQGFGDFSRFGRGDGHAGTATTQAEDQEASVHIPLEDAYNGAERLITLDVEGGRGRSARKQLSVKIPRGVGTGQRIRLAGQGSGGGDLYLRVELDPHPQFRVQGRDLYTDLPVNAWDAALGAEVSLPTPAGDVKLAVPPGTSSGQKLRLSGKGMPNPRGTAGDLYAEVRLVIPKKMSAAEREAWQRLRELKK